MGKFIARNCQKLEGGDRETTSGMLLAANSILKRFRFTYKSDALYSELKYVLGILAAPLTRSPHATWAGVRCSG